PIHTRLTVLLSATLTTHSYTLSLHDALPIYTIEAEVFNYLDKIEALGGAVRCIEEGFYDRELSEAAYRYQRQIETNERILVGLKDRKSTRLNSSHEWISYAVFCLKKKIAE